MEFGLHLSSEAPRGTPMAAHIGEMVTHARVADTVGFDRVGMGQHYLLENPKPQTVPMLGHLAAALDDAGLFTSVLLLPLHHPVEIAEQVTTLSNLAASICVGVGAGYVDREFRNFGVPKHTRGQRVTEGVEIMNRLWTEDAVTYAGEHYAVEDATITPKPQPKPPVWCGGSAPAAVERAARLADGWVASPQLPLAALRERKRRYDEIRAANAADTAIPIFREAYVAPSTEAAYAIATDTLRTKYESYLDREIEEDESSLSAAATGSTPFRDYAKDRFLIGSPAEVCEQIEAYNDAVDLSHVLMRVRRPGLPSERVIECLELIGDEVIPAV